TSDPALRARLHTSPVPAPRPSPLAFLLTRPPPRSTLFPYTTLFRSSCRSTASSSCWSAISISSRRVCVRLAIRAWCCSSRSSIRSEEHTSELQSRENLVCRLLLEKKKIHRPLGRGAAEDDDGHARPS